ncbi:DNA modification methylase [Desulfosarcina alkanivorans]|uniref:Methyltransferase n=1 Tax=Desulfosarcina alkanivorans TaxID=571177 RepID=A0A5K7YKK0_9BACT|nr:site-specific DNA-methyltransferase [Desulfosarcina alkanivorans]BBO66824.1 DNA modification methylase [Desulfosarcina alkanivorans]
MVTHHLTHFDDAEKMNDVATRSVHLVVTSPPYPMIEMWDPLFCRQAATREAMDNQAGMRAFELMHRQLDRVWEELYRVLVPGGIACINIGDATRTMGGQFSIYPNHSRILSRMLDLGFSNLPNILWRKQTNAPNKFMGSGMMPPGAYVTLEHEHILIFRKGGKRLFNTRAEKANRRQSAYFWEERNQWFSDVWMDLKGTRQKTGDRQLRQRSGAFPFELPYRLISMFSVMGDTVLDPFLGTGTTLFAAATAGRNSVGYETDDAFRPLIEEQCKGAIEQGRQRIGQRFENHRQFIGDRETAGKAVKHINRVYGFPVITRQESELMIPLPATVEQTQPGRFSVTYDRPEVPAGGQPASVPKASPSEPTGQLPLFD